MRNLTKMFMASSARDEAVLDTLAELLGNAVEPIPWTDDAGKLSQNLMDWAQATVDRCRFGLFVLTPDDRWGGQVNGNVLLELGLFVARHGLGRAFIVSTPETIVPPDLAGILTARFDSSRFKQEPRAALASAVHQIREELPRRRTLGDEVLGPWLEAKETGKKEGPYALVWFYFDRGELKVKGRSFGLDGRQRLEWPHELNHCWIPEGRDEVFHTFDAEYEQGQHKAMGVTRYFFEKDRQHGHGHFVVHGAGGIQKGQVGFDLQRVTDGLLASLRLPAELDFNNRAESEELIRALMKTEAIKAKLSLGG